MSIITTAQAVPSRLFTIYASVAANPAGEPSDRIEAWSTPSSLHTRGASEEDGEGSTTLFTNSLAEARRLGMVEVVDDKLRLTSEARAGAGKNVPGEEQFRSYLLRTLLDPERAQATQQSGFMLALAWFLTLPPHHPIGFKDPPQNRLRPLLGERYRETELTNLNAYQNFLYWARYLGFATFFGDVESERKVISDPTRAIRWALPSLFENAPTLSAAEFMDQLAAIYPVLEGGSARRQIEEMSGRPAGEENRLSLATSLALQRLATRQEIEFAQRADAPPLILDFGQRTTRITHIARKGH